MKKNFKLTTIIACVAMFIASLMLSISFYTTPVYAAGSVFEMEYGASVKLSENGLRFTSKMDKAYRDMIVNNDNVELWGYIAPTEEFDKVTAYSDLTVKVGGKLDESKIYQASDGYYHANLVITGLDNKTSGGKYLYGISFSAIVFIKDKTTNTIIYADLAKGENGVSDLNLQNRTQYDVVNAAMLDGDESYENAIMSTYGSWYGGDKYPIILNSQDDVDAFAEKIANNEEFKSIVEEKVLFIDNEVRDYYDDVSSIQGVGTAMEGGHRVNFWDGSKLIDTLFINNGEDIDLNKVTTPTRAGYKFVEWIGASASNVTENLDFYAKWKGDKVLETNGNVKTYGVTRTDGANITDNGVVGQRVTLSSGSLGDAVYYPGDGNPTDKANTADQSYLAFDGSYGFGDYFVADFTGKNMPTMAFFANNYNNSIFYGDGTKNGVVVATGLTLPDGRVFTEDTAYCTSVFNGKGLCMWGPHMIYSTAKNDNAKGVLLHSNESNVALGRENLVDGKRYRIIMGMEPGDDLSNKAIKLVYCLYDLDKDCVVESRAINTYNFFADGWANAGQTRDEFCQGSIVAYGYFGTATVLDKVYNIYEDTNIQAISTELGMAYSYKVSVNGDAVLLEKSGVGDGASYIIGQNNGGYVDQSFYAINGEYGLDDYVAFDFTGKNMPEVAFFAKNYNNSMYAEGTSKQGIVVVTGVTTWDGKLESGVNGNGTQINYGFPYMIQNTADGGFCEGALKASALGRANLVDGKHYRVIMGFTGSGNKITLHWYLYDLDTNAVVEQSSMTTWGFFSGSNAQVGNMTINDLSGSIVLYGKFGTTCTIDKLHGVFENTSIAGVKDSLAMDLKTVTFKNWDGSDLYVTNVSVGGEPVYGGNTPTRPGDFAFSSYTFAGWDKEISPVTDNITYTAVFTGNYRDIVTISGGPTHTYGVEQTNGKIVLKKSNLGDGANYTKGQNNGGYVHQSYLAFDGNYALNDYIAFDFTGKNLPEIAFFAKNYNDSMYAEGTSKQGIVVVTGITTWDGQLSSGVNGNGTKINYGYPYMIQDAADGGFCEGALKNSALGRANLVDGTHYRVIMGFTGSGSKITLHWYLYDLDTNAVVEQSSMTTWGFFSGSNDKVGNMTINDLSGSIVLYGKFGVACELDKIHGVFENTDLATVANGLNGGETYTVTFKNADGTTLQEETLPYGAMTSFKGKTPVKAEDVVFEYVFAGWDKAISLVTGDVTCTATYTAVEKEGVTTHNATANNGGIVLNNSNIGDSAHYSGSNNKEGVIGTVNQSYLAFDGKYGFNDYIAFDFTGKNMPSVAFFAQNYNESMYYQNGDKYGLVVLTGLTTWKGELYTEYNDSKSIWDGKGLAVTGPYMLHNTLNSGKNGVLGFQAVNSNSGSNTNVALGRANLVDGKQYRVIMGMEEGNHSYSVKIVYILYNVTDDVVVEEFSAETYNFFSNGFVKDGETRNQSCQGSIVLYGHFGTTTTIDKVWGVYEDTTLDTVVDEVIPADETPGEGENPEQPTTNLLGYDKYTDQFDFYAYSAYSDGTYEIDGVKYYIGKNLANLKQYSLYGEAGMTIYFPQNDMLIDGSVASINNAKKLIDDLAKVGIYKTILQDSRILYLSMLETAIVGSGNRFATESDLDAYIYDCLKDYATYPGVYGVQLGDEPKYACLSAYSAVYNSIRRVCNANGWNLFIQYNLNPLNVTENVYNNYYPATSGTYEWNNFRYKLGMRDRFDDCVLRYTQYINDFINAMEPDSIMYDDYPLMEDKNGNLVISDSYIPCLQIVAKAAADRGIKFYHVTQAYENNADGSLHRRAVTEKGAKWLNNILLGFGTKQIAYYTYYTRGESDSTGGESYVDGQSFVDYNGNPTSFYYWMQAIMANNQKFAPTIMQFDYKGSRVYGSTSLNHLGEITVSNSFTQLTSFSINSGSSLVTELYDDENNYYMYMAMNVADPDVDNATRTVSMTFSGYTNVLVYDGNGNFTNVALVNGVYTANLMAGDAVYVIPFN